MGSLKLIPNPPIPIIEHNTHSDYHGTILLINTNWVYSHTLILHIVAG